jgi:hypothetical protein
MPVSAKPGWNPIPPGFVASWGRGIDPGGEGGPRAVSSAVLSAEGSAEVEGSAEAEALAEFWRAAPSVALAQEGYRGRQK